MARLISCFFSVILLSGAILAQATGSDSPKISPSVPFSPDTWRFIVSGDSRNCGDIVMPAIAADSIQFRPSFYWHLGDLRAIYKIDEDMEFPAANDGSLLNCNLYLPRAWPDFIDHQIAAWGNVPFYVGIGNHEVIPPKDLLQFRRQFSAWLDQKSIRQQRADDETNQAKDAQTKNEQPEEPAPPPTYYHWIQRSVDFIYLDNSSESIPGSQVEWLRGVLQRARANKEVKSIVVGMHESLPHSLSNSHSMGGTPEGLTSGEIVYGMLLEFQKQKPVYVLASHSHFFMEDIFDTPELRAKGKPLPGWIVGTAGAERYPLPVPSSDKAKQDVYGYLVGTVSAEGKIRFAFQEIHEQDVPATVRRDYPASLIHWCFAHNSKNTDPVTGDDTPNCVPPSKPPEAKK